MGSGHIEYILLSKFETFIQKIRETVIKNCKVTYYSKVLKAYNYKGLSTEWM